MSRPVTVEQRLLSKCQALCDSWAHETGDSFSARLEILEAVATLLAGTSLEEYREAFPQDYTVPVAVARRRAIHLLEILKRTPIHPALSLSALARPPIDFSEQRTTGAFHTDFRLANLLAEMAASHLRAAEMVVDPACGTGILLAAAVIRASDGDPARAASFLRHHIAGADLSQAAIRGTRLALAALSTDVSSVAELNERLRVWDSLLAPADGWRSLSPKGFDVVVANPPWDKIKLSRHEFLRARGAERHYGSGYDEHATDLFEFVGAVDSVTAYGARLGEKFHLLGPGENDLYKPFLELFTTLLEPGGCLSVLVPAGLIRSNGTQPLRELLFDRFADLEIVISENRANYFTIDSRFKFLALRAVLANSNSSHHPILVKQLVTLNDDLPSAMNEASIDRSVLSALRPDLTVPEVRSAEEWRLFERIYQHGVRLDAAPGWKASVARELDMTRDRSLFSEQRTPGALPVIEGRMVHQHRFGAKRYVSGTGRRAVWDWVSAGVTEVSPQFWVDENRLSESVRARTRRVRVGFCDITGQTNERSMLAALVPTNVVCGNKVPTLIFEDESEERMLLWLGIVNSFTFDWMLRRVVTTTVNYFLLFSLPLPAMDTRNLLAQRIITAVRKLQGSTAWPVSSWERMWEIGKLRTEIDACVSRAYNLTTGDLELLLADFPLLDRAQPVFAGEGRSTVTRDVLLHRHAQLEYGTEDTKWTGRVRQAMDLRALPYVPSEAGGTVALDSEAQIG
jgi:SAM-dependent methyltransferase